MNARSYLILSEDPTAHAESLLDCGADALTLDLRADNRESWGNALRFLLTARQKKNRPEIFVWIEGIEDADSCLGHLKDAPPDGVFLDRATGRPSVERLGAKLAVFEAEAGLQDGATTIVALAAQSPEAVFALGDYAGCSPRLRALAFDAQSLAESLALDPLSAPVTTAKSLLILGAAAAGIPAIDMAFRGDMPAQTRCLEARSEGFGGLGTARREEISVINKMFAKQSVFSASRSRGLT